MKNKFLIFVKVLIVSGCSVADKAAVPFDKTIITKKKEQPESQEIKNYREQIKKCDDEAKIRDEKPESWTTIGISASLNEHTECYKSIAHQIIDKKYSKNANDMKKDMADYITISANITSEILRPDSCYPYCGTIVGNHAAAAALGTAYKYLEMLINSDSYWGEQ